MDIHTEELEYLLNNYWCIKEDNPSLYYTIKNNLDYYKDFIHTKLGSKLIVNDRIIKLEKVPSVPKSYMGITEFTTPLEYSILMIVLLFLEDKPRLEQFILSNLIEYIRNTAITLELNTIPDWNITKHRKCLVNVLNHLKEQGLIKVVEEISTFTEDKKAEGLYETTGLSNYYVREFKNDLSEFNTINDFINDEFNDQNENIGDVRRYRVYRHLIYSLVAYSQDLTEFELDYLKKFRSSIKNELDKYLDAELEITKNMALLLYADNTKEKFDFPNNKAITDIVLLLNTELLEKINNDEILNRLIKETKEKNEKYFSKNLKEMTLDVFTTTVINYMSEYDFIRENELGYEIFPMVGKITGYIPENDEKQLELFGGNENE